SESRSGREARECERHDDNDAQQRAEERAGRSHTDLLTSAARLTRCAGHVAGCASPVALRPRVTPGLPLSASLQAGTASTVTRTLCLRAPPVHLPTRPIGTSDLGRRTRAQAPPARAWNAFSSEPIRWPISTWASRTPTVPSGSTKK